jgi:hypothetical protein
MLVTKLLKITVSLMALVAITPSLRAQAKPSRQPIARIGDQPVYEEDLFPTVGAQFVADQESGIRSEEQSSGKHSQSAVAGDSGEEQGNSLGGCTSGTNDGPECDASYGL